MTTTPFEPGPGTHDQEIAAADPGQGAPDTAPGLGAGEHLPDVMPPSEDDADDEPDEPDEEQSGR